MTFLEFIAAANQIPAWMGTLGAALIAFVGVIVTISIQGARLRAQFRHDAQLKDREREMVMRKEIFLGTAEAFTAGLQSLARYADSSIPSSELLQTFVEKSYSVSRLYVVASGSTIKAVAAVMDEIAVAQLSLTKNRAALLAADGEAKIFGELRDREYGQKIQVLEMRRTDWINVVPDTDKHKRLDEEWQRRDKQWHDYRELELQHQATALQLARAIVQQSNQLRVTLMEKMITALCCLRLELALPIDETALRSILEDSVRKLQRPLTEIFTGDGHVTVDK